MEYKCFNYIKLFLHRNFTSIMQIFQKRGLSSQTLYASLPIFLHGYICHIRDILQLCSFSREGAIFWDGIENYFSCSHLVQRDRDYHMTILVIWDKNEITYCYSRVSRRDRDFKKSFLMVEREKMKLTLTRITGIENSRWSLIQIHKYASTALVKVADSLSEIDMTCAIFLKR